MPKHSMIIDLSGLTAIDADIMLNHCTLSSIHHLKGNPYDATL